MFYFMHALIQKEEMKCSNLDQSIFSMLKKFQKIINFRSKYMRHEHL